MNLVQEWMEENIGVYGPNERGRFLRDCRADTGAAERTVRHHYRKLFRPRRNHLPGDILEDNRGRGDAKPAAKEEPVSLDRSEQRERDLARIRRAEDRRRARGENALEEYARNLYEIFSSAPLQRGCGKVAGKGLRKCSTVLVNHLSDIHGNEKIDIPGNFFDFDVLGRRLEKLSGRVLSHARAEGAEEILVAFTGDILNHDDLNLDKRLNNSENRAKATFKMVDLLGQYVRSLSREFPVTVASVCGNEGRVHTETGYSDFVVSDNYDYTIFNILKLVFAKDSGVGFLEGDPKELVVEVCGRNILLLHGELIKEQCEANVSKIMGRYAAKGVMLRYVLFGHLHSARIGDYYGRSSSMCGSNGYSERGLNLTSRASQNLYAIRSNGDVDGIKIDLQSTDGVGGYQTLRDDGCERGARKGSRIQLAFQPGNRRV